MTDQEKNPQLVTIKGIVIPVDWDQKGNPLSVAIATHKEEEYLICNDSQGKSLLDLVTKEVEVTGSLIEIAGINIVKVKDIAKCKLANPFEANPLARRK
jgi:hypothetical protein